MPLAKMRRCDRQASGWLKQDNITEADPVPVFRLKLHHITALAARAARQSS
jgi:hypothetical protein